MDFIFLIILMFTCRDCFSEKSPCEPVVLKHIQGHLPTEGVLKNLKGFVYVDLDDAYIHELVGLIGEGFLEPPYFGTEDLVGAHITVAYPEEMGERVVEECGQVIHFTPKECHVVHPPKWEGIDQVCFVTVEAPELDQIREKYGLPKRVYEFHITIGIKAMRSA